MRLTRPGEEGFALACWFAVVVAMRFALLAFSAGEGDCCLFACGAMGRKEGLLRAISCFCLSGGGLARGAVFGFLPSAGLGLFAYGVGVCFCCFLPARRFLSGCGPRWALLSFCLCGACFFCVLAVVLLLDLLVVY